MRQSSRTPCSPLCERGRCAPSTQGYLPVHAPYHRGLDKRLSVGSVPRSTAASWITKVLWWLQGAATCGADPGDDLQRCAVPCARFTCGVHPFVSCVALESCAWRHSGALVHPWYKPLADLGRERYWRTSMASPASCRRQDGGCCDAGR